MSYAEAISSSSSSAVPAPRRHAAVVGAGPVGCLTALSLANRGYLVDVYERRSDSRKASSSSSPRTVDRSINLAISARGLSALSLVNVVNGTEDLSEVVLRHAIPMKARMIHTKDEGSGVKQMSQLYGQNGECINSVSRQLLNDLLLDEASTNKSVTLHFDCKLRSINLDARENEQTAEDDCSLLFENWEGGGSTTRYANFIVGCDGINSVVRNSIARATPLNFSQEYIDSSYLELHIPAKKSKSGADEFALDPNHLHIWPRHSFMLIALANLDKSFTSTLFAPRDMLSKLTNKSAIVEYFRENFPDALDLMGEAAVAQTLLPNKGKGSPLSSIKCNPYHYKDRAVFLGDAAHAMVPFYGQGLNCGFEDVGALMRILDEHEVRGDGPLPTQIQMIPSHGALSAALEEYTRVRHPDLLAINYLATQNFYEMSSRVVDPLYLLRKKLDGFLMTILPRSMWSSLYSMVTFSPEIGYDWALKREMRQKRILEGVLAGTAGVAAVGLGLAGRWYLSKYSRRA